MVDKGNDEKFRGLVSGWKFFSKCDLYVGVVGFHFIREYLDYWQLRRTATVY